MVRVRNQGPERLPPGQLMEGMTSDRTREAITSIRSTLAVYQRRRVPGTADLARRAREALA
ncbi:hypothetical protein GCM10010279_38160 [Streptomyces mutabilis]|nr:hypothetical protein GCM10010279_38160 [Streptomyces mutabilis]